MTSGGGVAYGFGGRITDDNLHDEMNFGPAAGQVGENVTNSSEVCTLFKYTCTG